jgi:hypothetical protein
MPLLGLGVWQVPDGPTCVHAVRSALELGYRHIDTAQAYGNESSVGQALRESAIARDEVFITTKFHPGRRDPLREAAYSIEQLEVDYVDLYLVHWPGGGATWAWPGMEAARSRSYTRAIGVSNFDPDELDQVLARAALAPVVDQVHFNPSAYRKALLDACAERGITLEAYSRWAPAHSCTIGWSRGSQAALGEGRPKSCCAGASSAASQSSRSRPTVTASPRTRKSSTSNFPPMTWRSSTHSIGQEGPERQWSANGGERSRGSNLSGDARFADAATPWRVDGRWLSSFPWQSSRVRPWRGR